MKLSVIHVSRGRPAQALITVGQIMSAASNTVSFEYLLVLDEDDPEYLNYTGNAISDPRFRIVTQMSGNGVTAYNKAAATATGDLIISAIDYIVFPKDWDKQLVDATQAIIAKPFYLSVDDGDPRPHYWSVVAVFSRKLMELKGHAFYPKYVHYYADVDFYDDAAVCGMIVEAKQIKFKHNHYTVNPATKKDATYIRSESTMNQDKQLYELRKSQNFKE